jgi:hypothetical protein
MNQLLPATHDRVQAHTDPRINEAIRKKTIADAINYINKSDAEISARISQLNREWDTERLMETAAAVFVLMTVAAAVLLNIWWLSLTVITAIFLVFHALEGWCPATPIIRRLGYRTASEIHDERTALRILRGDFDGVRREAPELLSRTMH